MVKPMMTIQTSLPPSVSSASSEVKLCVSCLYDGFVTIRWGNTDPHHDGMGINSDVVESGDRNERKEQSSKNTTSFDISPTELQSLPQQQEETFPSTSSSSSSSCLLFINNPTVALKPNIDLQIQDNFISRNEATLVLQELQLHPFQWEGFEQRRKVWRWDLSKRKEDEKSLLLPPSSTLQRITERILRQHSQQQQPQNLYSIPVSTILCIEAYPQNQTLSYFNANAPIDMTQVTTFETPNCVIHNINNNQQQQPQSSNNDQSCCSSALSSSSLDLSQYFVSILPINASLIETINCPQQHRSVNGWKLREPSSQHSASYIMPQFTLMTKRNDLLWNWRSRIAKILPDNNNDHKKDNNNGNNEGWTVVKEAVLLKLYHVPTESFQMTTFSNPTLVVQSPEFGYVPTLNLWQEQMQRRAVPIPPLQELLSIIVTTSPIPSHPSTELLERVFDTFDKGGGEAFLNCPKFIVCDGIRMRDESTTQKYHTNKQAMRHGLVTAQQNDNYQEFKQRLRALCNNETTTTTTTASSGASEDNKTSHFRNTKVEELQSRHGYGFALRHALQECVTTPYVIVIQHDRTFMRPTPIVETIQCMYNNIHIKYVGMSMRSNLLYLDQFNGQYGKMYLDEMVSCIQRPSELLVDAFRFGPNSDSTRQMHVSTPKLQQNIVALQHNYFKSQQYAEYAQWKQDQDKQQEKIQQPSVVSSSICKQHQMTLMPTFFWYDNIHICETKHYRDFIFDPKYKMVAKGGFVEDKLSPIIKKTVERLGSLKEAHSRFGCYLLDDHSGMFFTGHLDGGSFLDANAKAERKNQNKEIQGKKQQKRRNDDEITKHEANNNQ